MGTANSIEASCERLKNQVLAVHSLVQIISRTDAWQTDPAASMVWLLSHLADPLCESFYDLEGLLKEKISAMEAANG
ncbi:hypothetical protein [Ralstonia mannitolilytica]|uniref:Uncharacterized protein n=1 Tax=Ralstonia mannitolilytica TaxID=105219 RepID=A0AAD2AI69_9RALS|nr:hypothetical protein [Ralstonia mannitolilytica]MBY4719530.1 hypothetical protein [Ralstonia mannitolilytica]CAJ0679478.1 hypothetical protein R77591_00361 [Ralstonia mannitolilytica]